MSTDVHERMDRAELRRIAEHASLPTPVLDALDVLAELEWIVHEDGSVSCPDCRAYQVAGHHEDCGLAYVLHRLEDA